MIGAVVERRLEVDERVTGENALLDRVAQTLFDRGEEVLGNAAAEHFLGEDHFVRLLLRLEADPDVAELTAAAGLLLVAAVGFDLRLDLLAVRHAGGLQLALNAEAALELGAEYVELDVAGAGEDHLVGLGVVGDREGDVLLVQTGETVGDLVVLSLRLGGDAHGVARLRDLDGGQLDLRLGFAYGVAGFPVHLADGNNVAAAGFLDLGGLFAAHGIQSAELIGGAGAHIAQGHIGGQLAADELDEVILAELVGHGLEHETHGRAVRVDALDLVGRGDIVENRLQQSLRADAGRADAAEHGNDAAVLQTRLDAGNDLFLGEGHFLEILLHELLGRAGGGLHERFAQLLDLAFVGGGDGDLRGLIAVGLIGDVMDEVDDAGAVGRGDRHGADDAAVLRLERFQNAEVVAMLLVELGNVEHDGLFRRLEHLPAALRADGKTVLRGAENDARLDRTQRRGDLAGEVLEARAVDHVDLLSAEGNGSESRRDRYLALDFFRIVVADGVAVGDLALPVDGAGQIEHILGKSGLAAAAVTEQADIPDVLGCVAHGLSSPYNYLIKNSLVILPKKRGDAARINYTL